MGRVWIAQVRGGTVALDVLRCTPASPWTARSVEREGERAGESHAS